MHYSRYKNKLLKKEGNLTLDQVKALIKERGIEYFLCSFVEMSGAPKAKVVPVTNIDEMAAEGAGFAGFAAGYMGQGPHDPDMANIPDFNSLTIVPWRKNMAWVPGNIHVNDQPWTNAANSSCSDNRRVSPAPRESLSLRRKSSD